MGEVYRARDPRLERDVAVKVLPEHFVEETDSLTRFQTEARAVAALSHPNIVAVYDMGQEGDRLFVVTELLEGETMRSRLRQGPLGARKAAEYAAQVAHGLAAAHDKGIVHRDIKPENLFLTGDGRVKILDFGLARQAPLFAGGDLSSSPPAARPPEPPPPSDSDPRIPKALDLIVLHCLEKNPDERFQSARDLAFHLDSLGLGGSVTQRGLELPAASPRRRGRPAKAAPLGLALVGSLFEIGRRVGRRTGASASVPVMFQQLTDVPGEERSAQLGPSGSAFVFVSEASGNPDIYLQRVGGRNANNLTLDSPAADTAPAFSPDGERIAFRSERGGGGIFVMGSTGESVKRLSDFGFDPAWSPHGSRIG